MATRNTPVLERIIQILHHPAPQEALAALEAAFTDELLLVAGNTQLVAAFAQHLRLRISTPEQSTVLDYIAHEALVAVSIDTVEQAINTLFPGRFIEPGG